ncbi:MAG: toll/interleukin-1 receptor domain-containing protein [Hyphomonadaceae bacterium]|nr:toll/interleukin-1 receptor domain-containing protein [Hyphomonadaceae bacterium]
MFDAMKAVGWRNRYVQPALRQAGLLNANVAMAPDLMILVELWLWAVFFRFSTDYRALTPAKQEKLRSEAFQLSYFDYYNLHKPRLTALMREVEPKLGLTEPSKVLIGFQQLIRPTFEHSVIEAQHLPPLHENFDLATFRRVLSKVHPSFLEMPGMPGGSYDAERQRSLKLITQAAAVGQAQLYAQLTGILIPADTVLIREEHIPDMVDVFISYARSDEILVTALASRLEKSGIKVWYDRRIQPEAQFDQAISDQISVAKIVLTVWSRASVTSKWVRAESLAAFNADKLMQIKVGDCNIPTPFNIMQTIDIGVDGLAENDWKMLLEAVCRQVGAIPGDAKKLAAVSPESHKAVATQPWYHNHELWRDELIEPAMQEAQPILFIKDQQVGHAATLLLEAFCWGYVLAILQFRISRDELEHIVPMFMAKAPQQYWEVAKGQSPGLDGPASIEFIALFNALVFGATDVIETELRDHGQFETPAAQLFLHFLGKSEATISKESRHAAFPVSGEAGDTVLGVAALAGSSKVLERLNLRVLREP